MCNPALERKLAVAAEHGRSGFQVQRSLYCDACGHTDQDVFDERIKEVVYDKTTDWYASRNLDLPPLADRYEPGRKRR